MKRGRRSFEKGSKQIDDSLLTQKCEVSSWIPPSVVLSSHDKAHGLKVSKDHLICHTSRGVGSLGFRTIRTTHGIVYSPGNASARFRAIAPYFWECEILQPKSASNPSHVRIGWSTSKGELGAPVGYNKYSYGYRDISGSKIYDSKRIDNYGESFGPGDIIGCYVLLNDIAPENSMIKFYKNGKDQGVAYRGVELIQGIYYPAISIYGDAVISVNFGPIFILKYDIQGAIPISELHPMNSSDRKVHENLISNIRAAKRINTASTTSTTSANTSNEKSTSIPSDGNNNSSTCVSDYQSVSLELALRLHATPTDQSGITHTGTVT
eukprot:gene4744-9422_t